MPYTYNKPQDEIANYQLHIVVVLVSDAFLSLLVLDCARVIDNPRISWPSSRMEGSLRVQVKKPLAPREGEQRQPNKAY